MTENEHTLLKTAGIITGTLLVITMSGLIDSYGYNPKKIYEGIKRDYEIWKNNGQLEEISKTSEKTQNYSLKEVKDYESN